MLLVSAWASEGHSSTAGWADTRLLCVPRNQTITEGSRDTFVELGSGTSTSTASGTGTAASHSPTKPSAGVLGKRVEVGVLAFMVMAGMGLMI